MMGRKLTDTLAGSTQPPKPNPSRPAPISGPTRCRNCNRELPDNNWRMYGGNLIQICAHCKHPNGITLIELKDQP